MFRFCGKSFFFQIALTGVTEIEMNLPELGFQQHFHSKLVTILMWSVRFRRFIFYGVEMHAVV